MATPTTDTMTARPSEEDDEAKATFHALDDR